MSDKGLRPGAASSGGVGARAGYAAPKDAQPAALTASPSRVPPGPSGSGRWGGPSAVPQATAGVLSEAPMRLRGGGSAT
eukprot:8838895-Alexandrium_andersonii.AAC.1